MTVRALQPAEHRQYTPLVSVIMATYNCLDTLDEAIDSILAQTYDRWELIVCDDASSDGTYERLLEHAEREPDRIVVLRNAENSKLSFSLNRCLEVARGDLIARMDGDDVSVPTRLQEQVAYLQAHPEVHLVGTAMQRFDSSGLKDIVRREGAPGPASMRRTVPFFHATICCRREVYDRLGGYTVSTRTERGQDWDLWFRFLAQGFVGRNLRAPLYQVREDENAIRRRTLTVRLRAYRTTLIGFRLLGYPWHWYVPPTLELLKGLVPVGVVLWVRKLQHQRFMRATSDGATHR